MDEFDEINHDNHRKFHLTTIAFPFYCEQPEHAGDKTTYFSSRCGFMGIYGGFISRKVGRICQQGQCVANNIASKPLVLAIYHIDKAPNI